MTAEVAVMNKLAVALAADSTVTVGSGPHRKTYDTVNKLFTLSKYHPVGIMVYGNSEFMQFPWETIIKTYRSKLGAKSFLKIEDYAENFLGYLQNDLTDYTEENYKHAVMSIVFDKLSNLDLGELRESRQSLIQEIERLGSEEQLISLNAQGRVWIKEFIRDFLAKEDTGDGSDVRSLMKLLLRLGILAVEKNDFSEYSSGIVIAGFGEQEMFPTVTHYEVEGVFDAKLNEVEGVFDAKLKRRQRNVHDANRNSGALIKGFAQRDMVYRFMEGVDIDYQHFMEGRLLGMLFQSLIETIDDCFLGSDEDKREQIESKSKQMGVSYRNFVKMLESERRERFVNPIIRNLDSLPKDELANLAESLVSLTSVNRKVSAGIETVGGPIDVAVISKGDGFVWVNRKHYFDPRLNPTFVRNYLRKEEASDEGAD